MFKESYLLSINGGSSSIKFALYKMAGKPIEQFRGEIANIGTKKAKFSSTTSIDPIKKSFPIEATDYDKAAAHLIEWLEKQASFLSVTAIGHRIVHGMSNTRPELISTDLIKELKKISAFDPEHLPNEIALVELFKERYPAVKQIACFDTSFHTSMPLVAKLLAIPRRYFTMGIQRYGFHGLSYAFLMEELKRINGDETAKGKIILAHLGSGASLAAVKDGKSIDTSMGFTPTSGLPMGTRTGDLDPGVASYLLQHSHLGPKEFNQLINHESGLLGISETNSDMRALIDIEDVDHRAKEAIAFFCYQTKKWVGSFSAALGGLDTLVFSGGIGEHSPEIRTKICDGLEFLGIELDELKNSNNEPIISKHTSIVKVHVIKTNEELMIAKLVGNFLDVSIKE